MNEQDLTTDTPSWGETLEKERVATHEAGHAAMLVRHGETITSLSIDELHDYGAHVQGDGSSSKFLQQATIFTAGRRAIAVTYGCDNPAFVVRGSGIDYEHLEAATESFWVQQRASGVDTVRSAVTDLNVEANRIYPARAADVIVDISTISVGDLMATPTDSRLLALTSFVTDFLADSILMSPGMGRAVALAKERLLSEGTIGDPSKLSSELRTLIFD